MVGGRCQAHYLYEAQHVSGDTPLIIRSLKLHWQPLVFYTWKVVVRVVGLRCQAGTIYCAWQCPPTTLPATFHVWKTRGYHCSFRLLMMGGVSPETCWASYKYGIKKCWYIVASCWIFFMNCAMKHGSTNIKFCSVWMFGLCSRNLPCRADKRPCELSRYFHSFSSKSWFWYLLIIGYSVDWSKDFQIYAIPLYICGIFILSCIRPVPTFYCFTSEILY